MKTKIQELIKLVEESNIDELEVSTFWGGQKIRVTKNRADSNVQPVMMPQQVVQQPQPIAQPIIEKNESLEIPVEPKAAPKISQVPVVEKISGEEFTAPLVGTYYVASKPGSPPFVKEGDSVTKGQIICIIEAMKIFNDIESEINGTIHEMCVEDSSPVEYDQVIIKILPE